MPLLKVHSKTRVIFIILICGDITGLNKYLFQVTESDIKVKHAL